MPVLRPYSGRGAHLGTSTVPAREKTFHFDNCKVAQYIISENENSESLVYRNGKPTKLYLHAVNCQDCAVEIDPAKKQPDEKYKIYKFSLDHAKKFDRWIRYNHPECEPDQALKLLLDYYDYAYKTMRPELIRYKQKYGELK